MGALKASCWEASARAVTRAKAVGKRSDGSLAMLRIITVIKAGGKVGLINAGEAGMVLMC